MTKSKKIAVLIFDGVNSVDVAGPMEAFATVRLPGGERAYTFAVWSLDKKLVRAESGLGLWADAKAPERARGDILLIPGGAGIREPKTTERMGAWLRRHHSGFARVAAICTGTYALAESGLADGKKVTTHWAFAADLKRRYPKVKVDADALFLNDGKIYSSGGVTSGIDLALELIDKDFGPTAAMNAARELVVFLRRTGRQAQFSAPLKLQAASTGDLSDVCRWATNNLNSDLSVEALASRARLSPRQFSRRFKTAFGETPAAYIRSLRLDAARTSLSEGAAISRVAEASGFGSVDAFRRAFEQRFNLTPAEYQSRFRKKRAKHERS